MIRQITNSLYDQFIADFELRSILSSSSESPGLQDLREAAIQQFRQLGFPNTKVEDWKYINLTPFLQGEFVTEPEDELISLSAAVVADAKIPQLKCYHIVMVNGQYSADLSDQIPGQGIVVSALSGAMNQPAFISHFGKYIDPQNHFGALNTALFRDGLFIEIQPKLILDKPIPQLATVL